MKLKYFLTGLIFILLLPLICRVDLLLNSVTTKGIVVDLTEVRGRRGPTHYSIIEYVTPEYSYRLRGPENVHYEMNEKVEVIYNKKDPTDSLVLSFAGFYIGSQLIFPLFLLIVWLAVYSGLRQYKHPKRIIKEEITVYQN